MLNIDRYILTAAHCLCWFDDVVDVKFDSLKPQEPSLRCQANIDRIGENGKKYRKYGNQVQKISKYKFNRIFVVIGAKKLPDFDRTAITKETSGNHWSPAEYAYVMITERNGKRIEMQNKYDVGLILVPEEGRPPEPKPISILEMQSVYVIKYCFYVIFQVFIYIDLLEYFYRRYLSLYYRRTPDGDNHRKAYIAGYGSKFVFGTHSDDSPGTENNPSTYSSCMTSEKGPLDSRFKYCNTKKVTQNC